LAVAQAWLKDTQEQKKQPAATDLQKAYIAKSSGYERKNRLLLTGAVVGVMGVMTAAAIGSTMLWLKAQRQTEIAQKETQIATLRENATRVQNLLPVEPVEALILAIKATGESQSSSQKVRENTFPQVQSSLYDASGDARERNILRHGGLVNSVAFSPDGKTIVSGGADGTIRLWDTRGNPIGQPFTGHENRVSSVAFSPDGKTIVSGDDEGMIRLWDTRGNPIAQPIKGHKSRVNSVAFSPDGKTIVSNGLGRIRLWDTRGNPIAQPFKGHKASFSSVAFSPDGKTIVSGGGDGTIRL
jgi:WD40 repeat protein